MRFEEARPPGIQRGVRGARRRTGHGVHAILRTGASPSDRVAIPWTTLGVDHCLPTLSHLSPTNTTGPTTTSFFFKLVKRKTGQFYLSMTFHENALDNPEGKNTFYSSIIAPEATTMHGVRLSFRCFCILLVFATATTVRAQEYDAFRACVLEEGDGTKCVAELPENDEFRSILNKKNNVGDPSSYGSSSHWSWGGARITVRSFNLIAKCKFGSGSLELTT